MRASATYRAALRMVFYARRRTTRQLCCLLLTVAFISIPLSGMTAPRASSLLPLRTTLVPFDTSIQSPNPTVVQFSVAAPSGRRIALASNTASFPIPQHRSMPIDMVIYDHCGSGVWIFPAHDHPREPDRLVMRTASRLARDAAEHN